MRRTLTFCVFLLLASVVGESNDGWSLVRSHDGIDTHQNDQTHDGFKEFRGVALLAATFEEARDVIKDIPGNIYWLPSCRRSELVREISETEILVYIVSRAPWPVKDRDCVWKRHYVVNTKDHFLMHFTADEEEYEGEEGLVRILNARGTWEVKRIDAESTEVSFQYIGDGGGSVPRTFVNGTTKRVPEKAIRALFERIQALRRD